MQTKLTKLSVILKLNLVCDCLRCVYKLWIWPFNPFFSGEDSRLEHSCRNKLHSAKNTRRLYALLLSSNNLLTLLSFPKLFISIFLSFIIPFYSLRPRGEVRGLYAMHYAIVLSRCSRLNISFGAIIWTSLLSIFQTFKIFVALMRLLISLTYSNVLKNFAFLTIQKIFTLNKISNISLSNPGFYSFRHISFRRVNILHWKLKIIKILNYVRRISKAQNPRICKIRKYNDVQLYCHCTVTNQQFT